MKRFSEIVKIVHNDEISVVLKVIDGSQMDLICLGCFDGDETMFRVTKGNEHVCTVWRGKSHYDWHWGESGYTLVGKKIEDQQHVVMNAIMFDFGIIMEGKGISSTLYTVPPKKRKVSYQAMWFGNENGVSGANHVSVHTHGSFWSAFGNLPSFEETLSKMGYKKIEKSAVYHSPRTGCCLLDYTCVA